MKKIFGLLLSLVLIQSAHAIQNSKCMIEIDDGGNAAALIGKGYFPILSENTTSNGYHPGLKLFISHEGDNTSHATIKDQTGVFLAVGVSGTTGSWAYQDAQASGNVPSCSQLPR